jgi:hypothetical protein
LCDKETFAAAPHAILFLVVSLQYRLVQSLS